MSTTSVATPMISGLYLPEMMAMGFPERLATQRRSAGFTQQDLATKTGISVVQLGRYEAGKSQPTLDVIKSLAVALNVTTDSLVFDPNERTPQSDNLRLKFEAITHFNAHDQEIVTALIDAFIKKHRMEEVLEHRPTATTQTF